MKAAILTDLTKCIGCGACALACREINGLPSVEDPSRLSHESWAVVRKQGGVNIRQHCMHCLDPACVSVCPVAALHKTPEGPVIYREDRCIGCRYCMLACPFGIPKYEWDSPLPKVQKCIMCYEKRIKQGQQPACTAACPTGATKFGDREALIHEARERIAAHPDRYVDHIYGVTEAGGTSVLYLSPVPFADLGFKTGILDDSYPKLTWAVLSKIPYIAGIGGTLMLGIYWAINRRMMMEKFKMENGDAPEPRSKDREARDGGRGQ